MHESENGAAAWQVAILHRTSRIVSSGLSIDDMLQELVALTVEVTACDACLVYLPDHETGDIVLRASQLPARRRNRLRPSEPGRRNRRMGRPA